MSPNPDMLPVFQYHPQRRTSTPSSPGSAPNSQPHTNTSTLRKAHTACSLTSKHKLVLHIRAARKRVDPRLLGAVRVASEGDGSHNGTGCRAVDVDDVYLSVAVGVDGVVLGEGGYQCAGARGVGRDVLVNISLVLAVAVAVAGEKGDEPR